MLIHRRPRPVEPVFDRRGHYRPAVTLSEYRKGKPSPNRGQKFPAEPLSHQEVYALMGACSRGATGLRNRALIMVLWRTGLRCSEALALMPKDLDLAHGRVTVLKGKGSKRRVVALDPGAGAMLERWLAKRRELGLTGRQPLFCVVSGPSKGRAVYSGYVRALLPRLARKAGVEKRVHAHGLRHSYASYLAERPDVPLRAIQTMLGHSSLAITERYLHRLNPVAELELLQGLPWPEEPPARNGNATHPS